MHLPLSFTHAYPLALAAAGTLALMVAWLPLMLARLPLSLPILCVGLGAGLSLLPGMPRLPNPLGGSALAEHLAELCVLVSLMGAGLKLDRPLSRRGWHVTWRLLGITMPLSIAILAVAGWMFAGLAFSTALLLGAALAPTDPVLAGDIQVGPPGDDGHDEERDEVRFSLTSEAGLNDALAFPFVLLALGIASPDTTWLSHWFAYDVVLKLAIGTAVGWGIGTLTGLAAFRLPKGAQLARTQEGFVSLAITLLTYGIAELLSGYGFIAVFLAGVAMRHTERGHSYHSNLYEFSSSIEHLLTMVVLLLLGAALAHGLLAALTWPDAILGLAALLVIRPLAGWIGLLGVRRRSDNAPAPWDERGIIAAFGIRGIGSIYYLAYALNRHHWEAASRMQALIGFVVLVSIVVHGASVTPAMDWLEARRERRRAGRIHPQDNAGAEAA
ncbi:cation:proton antiporter [Lichenicoccus roseus]|nr:cation:proton antiporter [Lichenicoccus roseus]